MLSLPPTIIFFYFCSSNFTDEDGKRTIKAYSKRMRITFKFITNISYEFFNN